MPAKPYAYNRLVIGGPTARGKTWSIGLGVTSSAAMSNDALEAWLEGIAPDVRTSYASTSGAAWGHMAATGTELTYMAAYHYAAGGEGVQFQARYDGFTPQPGEGTGQVPEFLACCVSTIGNGAGRHNRGRNYCPADAAVLANHQFDATALSTVVAGFRDLIDHINGSTIAGESAQCVIASAGAAVPIARVRADSLCDTQRPRTETVADHVSSDDV